jgi:hypothetical protein
MGYPTDQDFEAARENRGPPRQVARVRPTIVCLCGSTRFGEAFRKANFDETLAGRIVLSIGCDFKSDDALGLTAEDKVRLDQLHFRKIDLADEVLILNVDGYIGESTSNELAYAFWRGRKIRFLDEQAGERYLLEHRREIGAKTARYMTEAG